jgi:predicted acylesterase/phospholipase RssA
MPNQSDNERSADGNPHLGKQRALTLAGGGPAVGIGLGVLQALEEFPEITFDVWSLSCVGAWLGCLYHASPDRTKKLAYVKGLMEGFFRQDEVYDKFPCPTVFLPDVPEMISAYLRFMIDPQSYTNLVVPNAIMKGYQDILDYYLRPSKWTHGDFCHLMLNAMLAPNPGARFLMSMIYKSDLPGMNKLWFGPDYSVLKDFDMRLLKKDDVPTLYHNAYNVDMQKLQLFSNRNNQYPQITTQTLCACSGLPYILSPVVINGTTYVEGATIDTVGFWHLLENHPDLDEIWVCRILDTHQIRPHHNLVEALNNLVMLFASTTSEDDVKLFKFHLKELNQSRASPIKLVEFPVDHHTSFDWTLTNLRESSRASYVAARRTIQGYLGQSAGGAQSTAGSPPPWSRSPTIADNAVMAR